ncbi:MAG: NAD(P)-binding domain-containing protein [Verrucomicrobiota bacterium]
MKIGVLGTGMVGVTIATKLIQLGHHVTMGSRNPDNQTAAHWANANGVNASRGTFTDAAMFSEMIILCTKGEATLEVIRTVGQDAFGEKVVVDVSNPLDFSHGMPPSLMICNTDSLGEHVQKVLPYARVVKTLNMVNCEAMIDPAKAGDPTMFLCGNHADAKKTATAMLFDFGWRDILDLGDIKAARGMEMLVPTWFSLLKAVGHPHFGLKIVAR